MKYHQIRNATAHFDYAGTRFLIDPMLLPKDSFPGFPCTLNNHLRNPTVDLPCPVGDIVVADVVIVTHTHTDHWDDEAVRSVPKNIPLFTQHEADQKLIQSQGFTNVRILGENSEFNGISLTKTSGQHGTDEVMKSEYAEMLGLACGVVFKHPSEKTVYLIGDSIYNDEIKSNLSKFNPDVVIINSGDAQVIGYGPIIMGKQDVVDIHKALPNATLIATHMEAVNHAALTRAELRAFADDHGVTTCLHIPKDGEVLTI